MPTDKTFGQQAPFPSDVPNAGISCLSYTKLLFNDVTESSRLFNACRTYGFFHVNLEGSSEGQELLQCAEDMLELDRQLHELELEEKMRYAYSPPQQMFGFKHSGRNKVESGDPDRNEFWNLNQDDILGVRSSIEHSPSHPHPDKVTTSLPLLKSFLHRSHTLELPSW